MVSSEPDPWHARLANNLGFLYFASAKGFDHLMQTTVVDANGKIYRQVYGMTFDTPLLVEPLKELVLGERPGESLFDVVPSPSCPRLFIPHAYSSPLNFTATEWYCPADT